MARLDLQIDYWNQIGPTKTFGHPVNVDKLSRWVPRSSRVLDYGCGYGRALGILQASGYDNLTGLDPASSMIRAARASHPSISFGVLDDYPRIDLPDGSMDAALMFAVLTCVPTDDGQRAIIAELTRVLRPSGVLYISDMWLQTDARNLERYTEYQKKYGVYGVFDLPEGVTVRHHEPAWIETLTKDYETLSMEAINVETMNGNPAITFQWFGRNPNRNRTI